MPIMLPIVKQGENPLHASPQGTLHSIYGLSGVQLSDAYKKVAPGLQFKERKLDPKALKTVRPQYLSPDEDELIRLADLKVLDKNMKYVAD